MMKDLPLTALRVFVVVNQYGSFTKAAHALGITQSAVSRHIAHLEQVFKAPLFLRQGPRIRPSIIGLQLHDNIKDAMMTIELTAQQLAQKSHHHNRLQVRTSTPSLAMTVIVPMLGSYTQQTGVQVDLITSLSAPTMQDSYDVLISRDLHLEGCEHWELLQEELICVGQQELIHRVQHLPPAQWPLVTSRSRPDVLTHWSLTYGVSPDQLQICATYDHLFFAISAAIAGLGLLVVPKVLVLEALENNSLRVAPVDIHSTGACYSAYINHQTQHLDTARHFCRWLKASLKERSANHHISQ
ncbi:MAG: LysR family transcriptional regulator [Paenalcaligenes sp.]